MKEIIRQRIEALENNLQKVKKKISSDRDVLKYAIEAEKINFAITQLYICLGMSNE